MLKIIKRGIISVAGLTVVILMFNMPGGNMNLVNSFYYVIIPDSRTPAFPDLCVVCGKSGEEKLKQIQITDDLGSVQFFFYGIGRDREEDVHVHVPIHDSCGKSVRNNYLKWIGLSLIIIAAIIALGVVSGWGTLISLIIGGIIAGPILTVLFSKPAPVELNHDDGKRHLKFSNKHYAGKVAQINDGEIIECRQHVFGNEERVGATGNRKRQ